VQLLCRRANRGYYQGARGSKDSSVEPDKAKLFGFFVRGMLAAAIAELLELKTAGGRLFVLRRRVIALLAIRTL
jgi:hypothetical protein